MKRILLFLLFTVATAGAETESWYCRGVGAWAPSSDAPGGRHYAPSREVDLLHLALDVTPDFKQRLVQGKATLKFKPILGTFRELKLDGVDLRVDSATATETLTGWQATERQVILTFAEPIPAGREVTVTIQYSAVPKKGLYFRTLEMGYKDTHVWTQGEPDEARHWFPCYDSPNDKFTSEITCRVPEEMTVLSNGRKLSTEKDSSTGLVAVRWLQDKPHANYLIALVAGNIKGIEDTYRDIPVGFFTPASQFEQAQESFKDTKDMLAFFEKEIGVPYPWAKYYQACVEDFGWGGMENTSLTILNDNTLHERDTETLRDSQGLVAHELAHQWFGDLVTCKDWANVWLNEGFATYYEHLYDEHKHGHDTLRYRMHEAAKGIVAAPDQTNAIVRRDYQSPEEQFGYQAYPKGAWVLHMLRSQLGADLYQQCVKTYLDRHQFGSVVTEDFRAVLEELSGRSFDRFFDQWVYHASQPDLAVNFSWDQKSRVAKVTVQQNQKLSDDVLLFEFPLPVRFQGKFGTTNTVFTVRAKSEEFTFTLPEAPEIVRIDPEVTVLARINFSPPVTMLIAQLADKSDALGRQIALEQLAQRQERTSVNRLQDTLQHDPFYPVRMAASKALRALQTDEALAALLGSTKQADARVRRQVVSDLGGYYRDSVRSAALQLLAEEKNPAIRTEAIQLLGAYTTPEVRDKLVALLQSTSYHNALAVAAINALSAHDDAAVVAPLLECLQQHQRRFPSSGFGSGLGALAKLARHEEKKDAVREFLTGYVNDPRRRVQVAALSGLGRLGDPRALSVLERFAEGPKDSPERTAAEKAATDLRAERKPAVELGSVRTEVSALQKENRQLRKDFDELKKRLDGLAAAGPAKTTNKPPTPIKSSRK